MNVANTCSELHVIGYHFPVKTGLALNQKKSLEEHSDLTDFLRELNRLRMTGALCDCVLATTDGAFFRVHRVVLFLCSSYFRTLFTTSLVDNRGDDSINSKKIYRIPNVSSAVLESIINYAYSGIVHVTEDNVIELLSGADQFDVVGIVNKGIDFLLKNMTAENCIGIRRFGKEYFMPRLEKEARKYILGHFVEIIKTEEFLEIKRTLLKDILEDNALNVPNEFLVWIAIKRWCQHKYATRQKYFQDLLPSVRLALLPIKQFKQIMDDPDLYRHFKSRSYIKMVSDYFLKRLPDYLSKNTQGVRAVSMFTPRRPHEVIFALGGWSISAPTNVLEIYDSRADFWKMIPTDDFGPRAFHQTLCLGDYIYIVGGSTGQNHLNSCLRFSITSLSFEEVSPMHKQRCFLSAAVLNGKIYAIGGFDGHERLNTVEFYDDVQNQWSYVSPMNEKRSDASASSLRDRLFVVGGFNGLDFLQTAECYYSELDQWFILSPMIQCRSGAGCVAMDDAVYAIGGYDGEYRLKSVEKYCLFQSQWFAIKPMKQPRSNFAVAVLEKKVYVMGGYDDIADDTTDQTECFDLAHLQWRRTASLNVARSGVSACTFSGVTRIAPYIKDDRFRCLLNKEYRKDKGDIQTSEEDDIL